MLTNNEFAQKLADLRPGSTFLSLNKYVNREGEVADHIICFHISYEAALMKSLDIIQKYDPKDALDKRAQAEVLTSLQKSIDAIATTPLEEIDGAYDYYYDEDRASYVKGCKLHRMTNTLHIFGLCHQKRILKPGNYPTVKSAPLTLAKKALMRLTPVGRFRQYRIVPGNVDSIKVEKLTLLPPENKIEV